MKALNKKKKTWICQRSKPWNLILDLSSGHISVWKCMQRLLSWCKWEFSGWYLLLSVIKYIFYPECLPHLLMFLCPWVKGRITLTSYRPFKTAIGLRFHSRVSAVTWSSGCCRGFSTQRKPNELNRNKEYLTQGQNQQLQMVGLQNTLSAKLLLRQHWNIPLLLSFKFCSNNNSEYRRGNS